MDANVEEVKLYENTITPQNLDGSIDLLPKPFLLNVHDPKTPANLLTEGIEISLGYETTITITPKVLETTDNAKDLKPAKRKCKMRNENQDLKIFKAYSQEACSFECGLKEAHRQCGCIPWNYPHKKYVLLCDTFGIYCFEQVLLLMKSNQSCVCPPSCDAVTYSYFSSAKWLDPKLLCPRKNIKENNIFFSFYGSDVLPKKFVGWYNKIVNKKELDNYENCRKNIKYRALVNFRLAGELVSRTTQDLRHSLADKISNFGEEK